jgi:hypothetical protein
MSWRCALLVLLPACTGTIGRLEPVGPAVPQLTPVAVAPVDGARPSRTAEGQWSLPATLWLQGGLVTVADGAEVKQRAGAGFATLPVGTADDARTLGAVRALTRRGGGVLLAAQDGFFHDGPGRLLRSPLSQAFTMESVRFVHVTRFVRETLWVTTATEALRLVDGRREVLRVDDATEPGALQALVGLGDERAVLVKGGTAYLLELDTDTVRPLARGLAAVTAVDGQPDGTALLGTEAGLVRVTREGEVRADTLAAEGEPAQPIVDVEWAQGVVLVTTARQVLRLDPTAPLVLAEVTSPRPHALVRDGAGDVWLIDDGAVVRLGAVTPPVEPPVEPPTEPPTPAAVSFAAEVQPFMAAHCRSCHVGGANYAPIIDLERYQVAKQWAARTVARLTDTLAPMPPASSGVLTPAQYGVVVRWVEGGMQP